MPTAITLKVGGKRERIEEAEAKEVLARFEAAIADGTDVVVTGLDLSCRQWTVEAINVLKPFLDKVAPQVIVLNLDDIIAGLETSEGLEIMERMTAIFVVSENVQEINFSYNAMGPRALEKVAPLLGAKNLKGLSFNNCGLSVETIPQLDDALKVDGQGPGIARLHSLSFDRNMVGVPGAELIGEFIPDCHSLTSFSFNGCRPGVEGSTFIVNGILKLAENSPDGCNLEKLGLYDCTLCRNEDDQEGLIALCRALKKCPRLTHLNLSDTGDLGEAGAGMVCESLIESGCKLVLLDLSGCALEVDGAAALQDFLQGQLGSLKKLHLETNELETDGVKTIVELFAGVDNVLEHLRLDSNLLDDNVIEVLLNANFPNLRRLTLKDNDDLDDVEDDRKEALRAKFGGATIYFDEEQDGVEVEEQEQPDAAVDDLAELLAGAGL